MRRRRATLALAVCIAAAAVSLPARAEVRGSGPVLALGHAKKLRDEFVIPAFGWRWRLSPGATVQGWGEKVRTDLSFVVEPWIGGIFGDRTEIEAQVVPMLHVEPLAMRDERWTPYLEAGIGVLYTSLDELRLGSHFLFSDDAGLGLSFSLGEHGRWSRVSIGYRFRHMSHAGIFGQPNSGMNTHFLVVSLE